VLQRFTTKGGELHTESVFLPWEDGNVIKAHVLRLGGWSGEVISRPLSCQKKKKEERGRGGVGKGEKRWVFFTKDKKKASGMGKEKRRESQSIVS